MYSYFAYGLGIHSTVPLPELAPLAGVTVDIEIGIGKIDWQRARDDSGFSFEFTDEGVYLGWDKLGKFLIRQGREITIDPYPEAEPGLIRLPLLGTVFAVLLHQRGLLVLHASAVEVRGRAVAFLGNKGEGKSTMAAALYARGHCLLSDDLVAIDVRPLHGLQVLPGFPQLKLWPQAAATVLSDDPDTLPELIAGQHKRARRITERFTAEAVPLAGLYVFSQGPVVNLNTLGLQESLRQLIAHTYISRFGNELLRGTDGVWHLRCCANLLQQIKILSLERPDDLTLLEASAVLVERNVLGAVEGGQAAPASSEPLRLLQELEEVNLRN